MFNSSDVHLFYFDFEDAITLYEWQAWASQRNSWPLIAVAAYLTAIAYGKNLMRDRKPVSAKSLLFLWNASLALFSTMGLIRGVPTIAKHLRHYGFMDSVCVNRPDNVAALWVYLFTMSKFVELGDTFFLVARKRNVMFLHWYHHVTVLLYTWFAFTHNASTGKYFIIMNYFVHSLMYSYFAAQTLGIRAPKPVSMAITSLQILQMVGGIAVLALSIHQRMLGAVCNVHSNIIASGILMYGSYFALFVQFFIQSYIKSQRRRRSGDAAKTPEAVTGSAAAAVSPCDSPADASCALAPTLDVNRNHIKSQ